MNAQITAASEFDTWFEQERAKGLTDIKLAISNQRGVSAQAVQNEILKIEALANSGRVKDLPTANKFFPDLDKIISSVSVA